MVQRLEGYEISFDADGDMVYYHDYAALRDACVELLACIKDVGSAKTAVGNIVANNSLNDTIVMVKKLLED